MRRNPGAVALFSKLTSGTRFPPLATKNAGKKYWLLAVVFLLWAREAYAQDPAPPPAPPAQAQEPSAQDPKSLPAGQSQQPPAQGVFPTPPPPAVVPPEAPVTPVYPAPKAPAPLLAKQLPMPAALAPAIEARMEFSTLSRVSSSNNKILYKGFNASITGQSSDRFGATLEVGYLRAANVFGTRQSNTVFTTLAGPVYYPYRRSGFVTSVHILGGAAKVSGVVVLTPSTGGYLKGTVGDLAWAFGGSVEKWFTESLAARVDIDALHTTFYNSAVKLHGEYDLRAAWGLIYYFGGRRGGKFRSFAGKQIE